MQGVHMRTYTFLYSSMYQWLPHCSKSYTCGYIHMLVVLRLFGCAPRDVHDTWHFTHLKALNNSLYIKWCHTFIIPLQTTDTYDIGTILCHIPKGCIQVVQTWIFVREIWVWLPIASNGSCSKHQLLPTTPQVFPLLCVAWRWYPHLGSSAINMCHR